LVLGVLVSNSWLIDASVGRPNIGSMNLRIELCSENVVST